MTEGPSATNDKQFVERRSHPRRRETDEVAADSLGPAERGAAPRARHVRIELARLDQLLNLIGELVIVRGRLQVVASQVTSAALHEAVRDHANRM